MSEALMALEVELRSVIGDWQRADLSLNALTAETRDARMAADAEYERAISAAETDFELRHKKMVADAGKRSADFASQQSALAHALESLAATVNSDEMRAFVADRPGHWVGDSRADELTLGEARDRVAAASETLVERWREYQRVVGGMRTISVRVFAALVVVVGLASAGAAILVAR